MSYVCCKRILPINTIECHLFLLEIKDQCVCWPHVDDVDDYHHHWGELQQECEYGGHKYRMYDSSAINISSSFQYIWATVHEMVNLKMVNDLVVSEETIDFILHHVDIFVTCNENAIVGYLDGIADEMKNYYRHIGIPYKLGESYIELTTVYDRNHNKQMKCLVLLGEYISLNMNEDIYHYLEQYESVLQEHHIYARSERNLCII